MLLPPIRCLVLYQWPLRNPVGPATWDRETFFRLADEGMNVARLNMSHGDHKSHGAVIDLIREYNALGRNNIAIMLDTKAIPHDEAIPVPAFALVPEKGRGEDH